MTAVFYISAAVAVGATFLTITRVNVVHSLLYFICSLLATGVMFFVLGATFVAALVVIINAGAIMVLFVFVIMMLNVGPQSADQEKARELEPGQMSLHDVRLIHGSAANTSGQRRAALIMRYMPATSHYYRSLVTQRRDNSPFNIFHQPLWLMRGVDRSGKNDFVHGHAQWRERYARGLAPVMESEG
jgi:hypothetical protein